MQTLVTAFIVSVWAGSVIGCESFAAERGLAGSPTHSVARAANVADPSQKHGFVCRTFTDAASNSHGYVVFVPHGYCPGQKPPVLMFLNGRGENGADGISIGNNFGLQIWEMQEFFPFLAVAPQCRTDGSWSAGSPDVTWAMQILDSIIQEFDADEDRVYLTGVSSGGSGVWSIGSTYPDRFAALVPLCGGGGDARRLANARMPIWNFYNAQDAADLVEYNRSTRAKLIELGLSPLVTEYPQAGHDCWNRAYRTTAMYGWLLEQSRSRNAAEPLFDYIPPSRLLGEWQQQAPGEWAAEADDILVGQGSEGDGPGLLISPSAPPVVAGLPTEPPVRTAGLPPYLTTRSPLLPESHTDDRRAARRHAGIEIHADVWLEPDTVCRIALLNADTRDTPGGLWLSVVLPDLGTGGLSRSDGQSLARLDPGAQRTLRPDAWNDIRLRLHNGRLTARLNGWPAVDVEVQTNETAETQYRCALATPDNNSEIRWRYVRTRHLTQ